MVTAVPVVVGGLTEAAKRRIEKEKKEKNIDTRDVFVKFNQDFTAMHPEFPKSKMLEFMKDSAPQPVPYRLIPQIIKEVDAEIIANKPLNIANATEQNKENEETDNIDKDNQDTIESSVNERSKHRDTG